ncbi:MAG: pitrilysin family protein [Clostridiales bacterium]|jgi:predicted Zn-dependent peptidase|nr:insulinase family protein [Eubacteriales bacterium]MDH7565186.1 pitrilysin family protein [Clostridiales bacterium]
MFKRYKLDNGIRVVCEKIPYMHSVSLGIWIGTGSRNENISNNGISHFIEHMLFKGTESKSAKEIAETIDNIGGQLNAFTGKECTCFYAKTLDAHINISLELLSDMFFNSRFDKKDIDVENKVILEEIGMYEDSPEELVHDLLSETIWAGDSLGYPILGTEESLRNINRQTIQEYLRQNYTPENTVISVAGNYEDDKLAELIEQYFSGWNLQVKSKKPYKTPEFVVNSRIREKDTEQVHICLGFNGIEQGNDELYALLAVNNILGGGMSSRLFQKIREEKGLAYSIYSYPSSYKDAGQFTIYAGMNPEHLEKVIALIYKEIDGLRKNGIGKEDLEKSKEQLKGSYILGLESTSSRMNSIGKSELLLGVIYTPEEILQKIDNITMEDIHRAIASTFNMEKVSFSAVGRLNKDIDFIKLFN